MAQRTQKLIHPLIHFTQPLDLLAVQLIKLGLQIHTMLELCCAVFDHGFDLAEGLCLDDGRADLSGN